MKSEPEIKSKQTGRKEGEEKKLPVAIDCGKGGGMSSGAGTGAGVT